MRKKEKKGKPAVKTESVVTNEGEVTRKKKSAGSVIATVVLILAILFAIFCSYTAYTTKVGSGVPSILGIRPFSVQSDSMAPLFYKGDLVVDTKIRDYSTLEEGDIITFWTIINGQRVLNTHRIVRIEGEPGTYYYTTRGDANSSNDTVGVHQTDVVGLYRFHIKGVGTALSYMQTSQGFFLCIVLPVAIFFVFELIQFIRALMAYNNEKILLEAERERAGQGRTNAGAIVTEEVPEKCASEPDKTSPGEKTETAPEKAGTTATEKDDEIRKAVEQATLDQKAELEKAIEKAKAEMEARIRAEFEARMAQEAREKTAPEAEADNPEKPE